MTTYANMKVTDGGSVLKDVLSAISGDPFNASSYFPYAASTLDADSCLLTCPAGVNVSSYPSLAPYRISVGDLKSCVSSNCSDHEAITDAECCAIAKTAPEYQDEEDPNMHWSISDFIQDAP